MMNDREFNQAWRGRRVAPADERQDMDRQLASHVFDNRQAQSYLPNLPKGMGEAMEWYTQLAKAAEMTNRVRRPELGTDRRALVRDPSTHWTDVPGTLPRSGRMNPALLRAMGSSDPLIQSILQNKKNRLKRHTKLVKDGIQAMIEGAEGFDIVPLFKPETEALTPGEELERQALARFILDSGDRPRFPTDGGASRDELQRESFAQMLSVWVEQRYILDAVAMEVVRTRSGKRLSGLYAVDGGTIARVDPEVWGYGDIPEAQANPGATYVQIVNGRIYTTFGSQNLYYDYANPRDVLGQRGYGISETEMSVKLTTGILNVLTTNNSLFDRNALPPGMLLLFGQINNNQFAEWQAEWDAYRLGAGGGYGLPGMNIKDPNGKVEYLRLDGAPSEMVFSAYINFLAAIRSAIFGVDVGELNISAFGGNNGGLSSGKDTQTRIDETRNRAFLPDVHQIETMYNEIIIPATSGRWRMRFVGAQKHDPKELRETFERNATVNEVRQVLLKLPPLKDTLQGEALSNNSAVSQMSLVAAKEGLSSREGASRPGPGSSDKPERAPRDK